jgi:hypothetical protein
LTPITKQLLKGLIRDEDVQTGRADTHDNVSMLMQGSHSVVRICHTIRAAAVAEDAAQPLLTDAKGPRYGAARLPTPATDEFLRVFGAELAKVDRHFAGMREAHSTGRMRCDACGRPTG